MIIRLMQMAAAIKLILYAADAKESALAEAQEYIYQSKNTTNVEDENEEWIWSFPQNLSLNIERKQGWIIAKQLYSCYMCLSQESWLLTGHWPDHWICNNRTLIISLLLCSFYCLIAVKIGNNNYTSLDVYWVGFDITTKTKNRTNHMLQQWKETSFLQTKNIETKKERTFSHVLSSQLLF